MMQLCRRLSVRWQVVVPLAERLEGSPEALLGALFVEGGVDVRDVECVDGGGEGLDLALALLDRAGEGDAEAVKDAECGFAHDDDARQASEIGLGDRAFDAEGDDYAKRVDAEAFEAFL